MLQAIVKNKAREFLLDGDQRRPVEDIMTACVFGGLRYLAPEIAGAALAQQLGDIVPSGAALSDVQLWPRRDGVESDVVLLGHLPGGRPLHVVVECKWATNVLGLEQVEKQRAAFVNRRGVTPSCCRPTSSKTGPRWTKRCFTASINHQYPWLCAGYGRVAALVGGITGSR